MAQIKLFNRTETIIRTTGKPYVNNQEQLVAAPTVEIPVECSIQPYREGKNSFNQPTGIRTIDAIRVYVPEAHDLITADEISGIIGDQLEYEGYTWFCKGLERWDNQTFESVSLIPAHNLGYFYRKDKV